MGSMIDDLTRCIALPLSLARTCGCAAQSNDDLIAVVRKFAEDYCKFEKATSSETVSSTRALSVALALAKRNQIPTHHDSWMPCCAPPAGQGVVFVGVCI